MHFSTLALSTLALAQGALAFPVAMGVDNKLAMRELNAAVARRQAGEPLAPRAQNERRGLLQGLDVIKDSFTGGNGQPLHFNFGTLSLTDLIDIPFEFEVPGILTTGKKVIPQSLYKAPSKTDQRGGCPGLNIMANYGFISRTGITTPGELMYGLGEMLGCGVDIALALIALTLRAGSLDLTTMKLSIGGTDARTSGPLSALAGGQVNGLFSKLGHNRLEIDGSTGFNDAYFFKTRDLNVTRWEAAAARTAATGGVFNDEWNSIQKEAVYHEGIATNPTFTWEPVNTLVFYFAQAYAENVMASSDSGVPNPPTPDVIGPFWGYDPVNRVAQPAQLAPGKDGVWYRREFPITALNLVQGGTSAYLQRPTAFGANDGKNVNTFTPIAQPFESSPTGLACFAFNAGSYQVPAAYGILGTSVLSIITKMLEPARAVLGCTDIS